MVHYTGSVRSEKEKNGKLRILMKQLKTGQTDKRLATLAASAFQPFRAVPVRIEAFTAITMKTD